MRKNKVSNPSNWLFRKPNFHVIEVKYYGPTNYKPSRIKLTSLRFPNDAVWIPYNHNYNSSIDAAKAYLIKHRYRLVGQAEDAKRDTFLIMSNTFHPLKSAKKSGRAIRTR